MGTSASKSRSRARPTRSSLSAASWSSESPKQRGFVPRGPLADAVEGLARDEQVPCEQEQHRGVGDAPATVLARESVAKRLADAEPAKKSVEDRQGADPARVEGPSVGLGDFPGGVLVARARDAVLR